MAIRNGTNTKAHLRDLWETDPAVVRSLERVLGFKFDVDVAGTPFNRKAPSVITKDPRFFYDCQIPGLRCYWDALATDWSLLGRYAFMNPPFTMKAQFIHRAELMARRGMTVVGMVPAGVCFEWYRQMEKGVDRIIMPDRRINFIHPMFGQVMAGVNFETMIPVWEPGRRVEYVRVTL
jgi:hypothetical protein